MPMLSWFAALTAATFFAASITAFATPRCDTCPRDSHGKIARSSSAKTEFKRQHPCPTTGKSTGVCPGWVIDHRIALKRGGRDSPDNLQWQTKEEAKKKDRWE